MINYFKPFQIMLEHDLKKLSPKERKKVIKILLETLYPDWDKRLREKKELEK